MHEFELESLPANELEVDPGVQRELNPSRVRILAGEFDETKMGLVVVSARRKLVFPGEDTRAPARYIVLDGQTRLAALRAFTGDENTAYPVLCQVFEGLTRQEEADVFLGLNNRAAVRTVDKFRIALVAGADWARELNGVLVRHGFEADRGIDPRRRFTAIASAQRVVGQPGGLDALDRAFDLLVRAWGHQTNTASSEAVEGTGLLYLRHGADVDTAGFAARLGREDNPRTFKANTMAMRGSLRLSRSEAAYRYTLSVYNHGLRTKRLEPVEQGK